MDERLLVIDADPGFSAQLSSFLRANRFRVVTAADSREGIRMAYGYRPHLILLGLVLLDQDARRMCAQLRDLTGSPILMLTESSKQQSVVACLEAGADDCIGKPVRWRELDARVRALLRRVSITRRPHMPKYDDGRLCIDPERYLVWRSGSPVHLSRTEFRLLSMLVRRSGNVVSHEELLAEVWGPPCLDSLNYLSVYVRYIREKLEEDPSRPQYIQTKRGVGYRFVPYGISAECSLEGR